MKRIPKYQKNIQNGIITIQMYVKGKNVTVNKQCPDLEGEWLEDFCDLLAKQIYVNECKKRERENMLKNEF